MGKRERLALNQGGGGGGGRLLNGIARLQLFLPSEIYTRCSPSRPSGVVADMRQNRRLCVV